MHHANVNVNLMVNNVIQIKRRKINVGASEKSQNIVYVKKIIFGILLQL